MADVKDYITYPEEKGTIFISEDVVSKITAAAASETEGVEGMATNMGREIASMFTKKVPNKGVRVLKTDDGVVIDVFIIVKSGYSLQEVGCAVQKNIQSAIEAGTGRAADVVNVNICGVTFDR